MALRYVDNVLGNNSNPGTEALPWATIAYAKTQLVAGDFLFLRGGATYAARRVYTEGNTISAAAGCANGSVDNPITITNYPGEFVSIRAPNGTVVFTFAGRSYWTLQGDTTDNPDDPAMNFEIDCTRNTSNGYAVVIQSSCDNIRLRSIKAYNAACNPGIIRVRESSNTNIAYCRVGDQLAAPSVDRHGIYISSDNVTATTFVTIEYCTIYDCTDLIQLENSSGSRMIEDITIRYNHLYVSSGYAAGNENFFDNKDGLRVEFYGNTCHGKRYCDNTVGGTSPGGGPIVCHQQSQDVFIYDNTFYDCAGDIACNTGLRVEIYRNLFYDIQDDARYTNPSVFTMSRTVATGNTHHRIYHNTIYGRANGTTARLIRLDAGVVADFVNNICHTTGNISLGTGATLNASYNCWYNALQTQSGTGDVTSDPLFNDAANDDFRLTASSPCINAGTNLGSPYSTGYYGSAPDMGYYEYGFATSLAFVGFPASGTENVVISTFTVRAARYDGTTDTAYAQPITISKSFGPGNVTGTLTRNPVSGVSTFDDIRFSSAGSYALLAASGTLISAVSSTISISSTPTVLIAGAGSSQIVLSGDVSRGVFLFTFHGEFVADLSAALRSYSWSRAKRTVGKATFVFAASKVLPNWLGIDRKIEIWRSIGTASRLDSKTQWLIRAIEYSTSDSGEKLITVRCKDLVDYVSRRIIPYNPNNGYTQKLGPGDNLIKAIMRENFGALALDSSRQVPTEFLEIAPDIGAAPTLRKDGISRRNILEVLNEICETAYQLGTYLTFDLIPVSTRKAYFDTFTNQLGANQPNVMFGSAYGNAQASNLIIDYENEKNFVYALGEGVADILPVATASDIARIGISPLNRVEATIDARVSGGDATYLESEAQYGLKQNRPRISLEVQLIETPFSLRGIHYDFGDLVGIQEHGYTFTARLDAMTCNFSETGIESTTALLRAEEAIS